MFHYQGAGRAGWRRRGKEWPALKKHYKVNSTVFENIGQDQHWMIAQ